MQSDLYANNITDKLLPMPSTHLTSNSSDPAIAASYYDSAIYEPRSNFYDYNVDIVNYTYYYNDVAYTSNYSVIVETKKALDEVEESKYVKPVPILGMHPFKFFSMIVCFASLIMFFLYIETVLTAGKLLKNRKYRELGNGTTVVEW